MYLARKNVLLGFHMTENIENEMCPAPLVFAMIGGKWKLTILQILIFKGTKRFGELRREIGGITQTMLTKQLRALEQDGLVAREVFAEVPPRVQYSATADAMALRKTFKDMHAWWIERKTDASEPASP